MGAAKCGLVAIEGVITIALGNVRGRQAPLLALNLLAFAGL
jgi:hypothetical protein